MLRGSMANQHKDNWLEKIIEENNFCCGLCRGVLDRRLAKEAMHLVNRTNDLLPYQKYTLSQRKRVYTLRTLDPISKGRIFQSIITNLQLTDPFNNISVEKYSKFINYLETYFERDFLKEAFKNTYVGSILDAWERKVIAHELVLDDKLKEQKTQKRIRGLLNNWEHEKRKMRKKARDQNRMNFLNKFKKLTPIRKLELILNGETAFPYQSIPDECLFKVDLTTRFLIQRRFKRIELELLKTKFGSKKRKNKRPGWVRILKGL